MSLRKEAGKGVLWVAAERFGQQLIQVVIFIVLARLLTPQEFGLIAMIMVVFEISQSFIDSGMGQALIREKTITDIDRSTVFWFNLLLSVVFYILIFLTAPFISAFYDQPELTSLVRIMGLSIFASAVSVVQRAEMTQRLEFKKQAFAQIPAVLLAGFISVTLAYLGFGVWSLVCQFLLVAFISSIMLWILNPINIQPKFNRDAFLRLFGFGYKLLLSGLLNNVFQNIYKLVIGKFFAAATLGLYTQAKRLKDLASQNIVGIIQKVTYPFLVQSNNNPERLKNAYRQIIQVSSFIIIPLMILLVFFAHPILYYVLGEQWGPAAPFLQLICISGVLYHLHAINLNLLQVYGRSDLFLKLEILKKINTTIAVLIGLQFGIYGLLIAQVISSYIALFINTYYTAKFLNYSISEQSIDVLKVGALSIPMIGFLLVLHFTIPVNSLALLFVHLILGICSYGGYNYLVKSKVFVNVISFVKPLFPSKFQPLLKI